MRTSTLPFPHDVAEPKVARVLEQEFGAAWFPEYHSCSFDTDDANDQFLPRCLP
jgi:hypothetical protein